MPPGPPIVAQNSKVLKVHFAVRIEVRRESGLLTHPASAKIPQVQKINMGIQVHVADGRIEQRNIVEIDPGTGSPDIEKEIGGEIGCLLHGEDVSVMRRV